MKIVIASDKFKGTLTGAQVAQAVATGLERSIPGVQTSAVPVADGGEGTVDAALDAGFTPRQVTVTGPTGQPLQASYALKDGVAVIEMAAASGLDVLPEGRKAPLTATSYGTGELIKDALDAGATQIVLGVGGSATTDAGAGMLQALGASFRDASGDELPGGGGVLEHLSTVDLSKLDARLRDTTVLLAADVDNPLTGANGAAHVFGPQKGADEQQVAQLDAALGHFADQVEAQLENSYRNNPGAGAAGGMGYAAMAVLGATRRRGIDVVLEFTGLEQALQGADAVITGEGSLDSQSLEGKTPIGVSEMAAAHQVPVYGICGRTTLDAETLQKAGFRATVALMDLVDSPEEAMARAAELVVDAAEKLGEQIGADLALKRTAS
ncbi:glycerate kinase [Glutamicibacter endophyticus]|uniref:glycerate kinase n=1 Tax=Glutamicibacter endophyticus TaxID=1522174 RepID=UPI003AF0A560